MIHWIASYPKSGNTWFRMFLANIMSQAAADINRLGIIPNFDNRQIFDEALGWESSELPADMVNRLRPIVQESFPGTKTRYFKVHEAFVHPGTNLSLFSSKVTAGAFYIIRNPLDVVVSFANHLGAEIDSVITLMNKPDANLKQIQQITQPMGTWSWHVKSWVDAPNLKVHVLRYEDMLAKPEETFTGACRFAGLRVSSSEAARAFEFSQFERLQEQEREKGFKERPAKCPVFFRSGKAGGWRESLTEAQVDAIVSNHREVMARFGYVDSEGRPT